MPTVEEDIKKHPFRHCWFYYILVYSIFWKTILPCIVTATKLLLEWLYRQAIVDSKDGILISNKKEQTIDRSTWMNLKCIMVSETSQT